MLLESFKPESLRPLRDRVSTDISEVERQLLHVERLLAQNSDASTRHALVGQREQRIRRLRTLQNRLAVLQGARYEEDAHSIYSRTLRVA